MKKQIKKLEEDTYEELEEVFKKIENSKVFKIWFGEPCPDFNPLCFGCKFWTLWNKFKLDIFEDLCK